ncbi:hypothetical protein F5Y17DRAFT_446033 [Xylariaceae sp. FL0594]|nr:hypothetical protein F5Y17DRAFT_446033 [Xylariaceae sp. FL0594]
MIIYVIICLDWGFPWLYLSRRILPSECLFYLRLACILTYLGILHALLIFVQRQFPCYRRRRRVPLARMFQALSPRILVSCITLDRESQSLRKGRFKRKFNLRDGGLRRQFQVLLQVDIA